jgi:endoglucanase
MAVMRRIGKIAIACSLLGFLAAPPCAVAAPAQAAEAGNNYRRGIAISDLMAWAPVEPGQPGQFVDPPFSALSDAQFSAELQMLRKTGFDFVRLAVDPGPFLQFQGSRRQDLDRVLVGRVKLILASGLSVVVDFHPSDVNPDYTAQALTAGPDAPIFRAYLRLLERAAGLLGALHSNRIALELMNEPPVRPSVWQPMLAEAYAAARSGSAALILVLEGGDEASATALMAMRTAAFAQDPAALLAFHYYDPYQFTHQGAPWNAARYLADVPYPARARPLDDSLAATAALIAASDLSAPRKSLAFQDAQKRLADYWSSGFDSGSIAGDFAQIAGWARSQGIPADRIMLGEFGARLTPLQLAGAGAAERAQWFHDVSQAAEASGFGWAVWTYRGVGGFALAEGETGDAIDPRIAAALGLPPHPRKAAALPVGRVFDRMP